MRFTALAIFLILLVAPAWSQSSDQYVALKDPGLGQFFREHPQFVVAENAPSSITIAPASEPGERLVVTGQVTDGAAPVKGAFLYVYHTDTNSNYSPDCIGCGNHITIARLHGGLRTDVNGRYRFETIRPAGYNDGPAHLHFALTTPAYAGWQFEMDFADDPIVRDWRNGTKETPDYVKRGRASIRPASKDAKGVWHVTQDIVLKRE